MDVWKVEEGDVVVGVGSLPVRDMPIAAAIESAVGVDELFSRPLLLRLTAGEGFVDPLDEVKLLVPLSLADRLAARRALVGIIEWAQYSYSWAAMLA